ncbi:Uncharacterised protein [Mycobacteroides abscessus subsp. abscessus]|nr:Uncharacterised protein [Mycobacteroides abscessus subsp. abscessus]
MKSFITKLLVIKISFCLFSLILEDLSQSNVQKKDLKAFLLLGLLIAWRRPTLTGGEPPTTIGAEKLNFRVRYGNGCDLLAIATRLFIFESYSLKTRL